jgi:hypothetical protein
MDKQVLLSNMVACVVSNSSRALQLLASLVMTMTTMKTMLPAADNATVAATVADYEDAAMKCHQL